MGETAHFHPGTLEETANLSHSSVLAPLTSAPVVPLELMDDPAGLSRIGGSRREGLVLPQADFASGYHFIGELDLSHIGGRSVVPLIYPLFVDYHAPVFVDVADPLRPSVFPWAEGRLFNLDDPDRPWSTGELPYGPVREDGEIADLFRNGGGVAFQERRGSFRPVDPPLPEGQVIAGVPRWLQPPELPICPKTGVPMRFAALIGGGQPIWWREVSPEATSVYAPYFDAMTFWNDDDLTSSPTPRRQRYAYTRRRLDM